MSMHFDDRWFNYHDLNDDLEPEDLIGFIHQEMREAELRQRLGFPEEPEPERPSPKAKSPRKRANFFSALVDEVISTATILISEGGEAFAYNEKRGCYQPIPQLVAWLANFFPEFTSRSLLANDFREIAQRLAWRCDIQCRLDAFNGSHSAVNLENGVFDLEANQLLEHNPHFRFNYQVHANYLTEPERVHCPVFEEFCNSSLDGDPDKRQLLLEMIGYICSGLTAGKCAFFLKGQPNSGKSVISEFICRLFDSALISNVPLHQLGDRFARAENWPAKRSTLLARLQDVRSRTSLFSSLLPEATASWGSSRVRTRFTSGPRANFCSPATRCRGLRKRTLRLPLSTGSRFCSSTGVSPLSSRTSTCWIAFCPKRILS